MNFVRKQEVKEACRVLCRIVKTSASMPEESSATSRPKACHRRRPLASANQMERDCWLVAATVVILQALVFSCHGQLVPSGQPTAVPRVVTAVQATETPHLNGDLDQTWSHAALITTLRQQFPHEGTQPTQHTEIRVLYDSKNLYIGVHCFDSSPKKIVATELQRDGTFKTDDYVSFLISPNNDGQSGYIFTVNPLGTQFDSYISEEGILLDPNWNGIWHSDAHITSDGWTATLAIPFATMNFKASPDATIGFNVLRFIRRNNEKDLWQSWRIIYGLYRISEAGEIGGLKHIGHGRLILLQPFALGGFITNPNGDLPGQTPASSNSQNNIQSQKSAGFNFKYGLRSNLVANLTVNPDFSNAEVDQQYVNTTPFPRLCQRPAHFSWKMKVSFSSAIWTGEIRANCFTAVLSGLIRSQGCRSQSMWAAR